jgi:8-oxo-dGTP diphosphatase
MAVAFLINNDDFLLLKRSESRKFAPGVWAGVGGHIEPEEINTPYAACAREIFEETGISEEDIEGLRLHYIIIRRSAYEIRISYVYFGHSRTRVIIDTDEGKLSWIHKDDLFQRNLSVMNKVALSHYINNDCADEKVFVGTLDLSCSTQNVVWSPILDCEGM